jgi:peptidoglycan endopeptidase LytE
MILKQVPRALVVCCACALFTFSASAQTSTKHVVGIGEPTSVVNDDPVIISVAGSTRSVEDPKPIKTVVSSASLALAKIQLQLFAAIEQRLGAPYNWGSEGPNYFDCSGFVWSSFHSVGVDFERGSARTLWHTFEAPTPEETYKLGTLVFFSHQTHVGIVADEKGFYHASRHHGVVYAPFNDYWLKRIDGFRRVPMASNVTPQLPAIAQKVTEQ